jgi:hypothetical protein
MPALRGRPILVTLIAMRVHHFAWSLLAVLPVFPIACDPLGAASGAINTASVKFSEGSPAVDGQTIAYSGSTLSPSLDKFKFKMTFHVKADNSGNSGKAAFGSDAVHPIVELHVNSRSALPIQTPIPSFSIAGGAVETLDFLIEVPLTALDKATARKIANGDAIPYFLTGTLKFDVLEGTTLKGAGVADLDLASGEIETRPSGQVTTLLAGLL